MERYKCQEKDWKLFRKKLPRWQENAIEKMNEGYMAILTSEDLASEKAERLFQQIMKDRQKVSFCADMRRSRMVDNIVRLLGEKAIVPEDLADFSEELQDSARLISRLYDGE